jgi:hypothetical protein
LKVRNRSYGQKDIITPTSHDGITFDNGVAVTLEKFQKGFLHLGKGIAPSNWGVAYESVLIARGIAARLLLSIKGPEGATTFNASLALEALLLEKGDPVNILHLLSPSWQMS